MSTQLLFTVAKCGMSDDKVMFSQKSSREVKKQRMIFTDIISCLTYYVEKYETKTHAEILKYLYDRAGKYDVYSMMLSYIRYLLDHSLEESVISFLTKYSIFGYKGNHPIGPCCLLTGHDFPRYYKSGLVTYILKIAAELRIEKIYKDFCEDISNIKCNMMNYNHHQALTHHRDLYFKYEPEFHLANSNISRLQANCEIELAAVVELITSYARVFPDTFTDSIQYIMRSLLQIILHEDLTLPQQILHV